MTYLTNTIIAPLTSPGISQTADDRKADYESADPGCRALQVWTLTMAAIIVWVYSLRFLSTPTLHRQQNPLSQTSIQATSQKVREAIRADAALCLIIAYLFTTAQTTMRAPDTRPKPLEALSKALLAPDLLTPATPLTPEAVTPSSSTALGKWHVELSEPPTPTSSSFGVGMIVKLSDGELAVRSARKTLRIDHKEEQEDSKGKDQELSEGDEVEFRTDGCKAFNVRKRGS